MNTITGEYNYSLPTGEQRVSFINDFFYFWRFQRRKTIFYSVIPKEFVFSLKNYRKPPRRFSEEDEDMIYELPENGEIKLENTDIPSTVCYHRRMVDRYVVTFF